jgi:hypothetical protein
MARRDAPFGYTVAFIVLVAGLGIGASLVYLLVARPVAGSASVEVSEPTADDCPVGARAPVCYRFEVTNTGGEAGSFSCQASPPTGSLAVFQNGEPRTVLVLGPGQVGSLFVKVTPLETDVVNTPGLECGPPS